MGSGKVYSNPFPIGCKTIVAYQNQFSPIIPLLRTRAKKTTPLPPSQGRGAPYQDKRDAYPRRLTGRQAYGYALSLSFLMARNLPSLRTAKEVRAPSARPPEGSPALYNYIASSMLLMFSCSLGERLSTSALRAAACLLVNETWAARYSS